MSFARRLVPVLLFAALAACAPTTVAFRADDGPRLFTLTADGAPVPATADAFVLAGDGYDLTLTLSNAFVNLTVDNRSASLVRVLPVFSRFTLADGATSAVVTGAYLRDRSLGALPFDVEPASEGRVSLIPLERVLGTGSGVGFDPMFPWPITEPTTFALTLAIDEAGDVRTRVLVFAADGPEAP